MTSPSNELQSVIFSKLTSSSAVTALVGGRVYDRVPENVIFPYISFGAFDEDSDDAECIDGFNVAIQMDVWSRAVGFIECRAIADAVRQALDIEDLQLTHNALVTFQHRQTRVFRDPDGLTSHAAITFEAFVEQP